jgi:two-component system chemotaxis response regulator CheB
MAGRDIIVIGTSFGGVKALTDLVHGLPPGFPAALFVVCHFPPDAYSRLPEILSRSGPLLAAHAQDGEPVLPGRIYVAPPDFHMLLAPGAVRLSHGPRENGHRPAIDPLFRTAARAFGPRVVGVILTGARRDGAAGLMAVRADGGVAVVQSPEDALVADMPEAACNLAGADHVVPLAELPALLVRLVREAPPPRGAPMTDPLENMPPRIERDMAEQQEGRKRGQLTVFTCPECGGSMWQVDEKELTRFRCHTGHVYYGDGLLAEQSEVLEAALWTAVRAFREKAILAEQLAVTERAAGRTEAATRFEEESTLARRHAEVIQHMLMGPGEGRGKGANRAAEPVDSPPAPTELPPKPDQV